MNIYDRQKLMNQVDILYHASQIMVSTDRHKVKLEFSIPLCDLKLLERTNGERILKNVAAKYIPALKKADISDFIVTRVDYSFDFVHLQYEAFPNRRPIFGYSNLEGRYTNEYFRWEERAIKSRYVQLCNRH